MTSRRRPRTSTLALATVWLATLVLYLLVRPDPEPAIIRQLDEYFATTTSTAPAVETTVPPDSEPADSTAVEETSTTGPDESTTLPEETTTTSGEAGATTSVVDPTSGSTVPDPGSPTGTTASSLPTTSTATATTAPTTAVPTTVPPSP